jgi:hypothetical protein
MIKKYLFIKLKELAHSNESSFWLPIYKIIKRKGGNAIMSIEKMIEENEIKLFTKNMVIYGGVAYKDGFIIDNKTLVAKK